jgi:hypothetical protein
MPKRFGGGVGAGFFRSFEGKQGYNSCRFSLEKQISDKRVMRQAQRRYLCLAAGLVLLLAASSARLSAQAADANSGVLSFGAARLNYDPAKWTAEPDGEAGKWKLRHTKGDAYGHFIAERLQVPEDAVVNFFIKEIRANLTGVKVLSQETRTIGGAPVTVIRYSGAYQGLAMTGEGCYYGGKLGAVQVFAWTGTSLFDEYESDFDELCDGLEMGQKQSPGTVQSVGSDDKTAPSNQPAAPPPPAIFILKNGERLESSRYTMTADSVRVQQGDSERTIPISGLNLDATNAANHARGLNLQIPTSKNQMILSF